jgi:hypothetical protein
MSSATSSEISILESLTTKDFNDGSVVSGQATSSVNLASQGYQVRRLHFHFFSRYSTSSCFKVKFRHSVFLSSTGSGKNIRQYSKGIFNRYCSFVRVYVGNKIPYLFGIQNTRSMYWGGIEKTHRRSML